MEQCPLASRKQTSVIGIFRQSSAFETLVGSQTFHAKPSSRYAMNKRTIRILDELT